MPTISLPFLKKAVCSFLWLRLPAYGLQADSWKGILNVKFGKLYIYI